MLVFEIAALLLVLAAVVSAIRTGLNRGDWQGVYVIVGIAIAAITFYLVLKAGNSP